MLTLHLDFSARLFTAFEEMRGEQQLQTELLRTLAARQSVQEDEQLDELPDQVELPLRSVVEIRELERLLAERDIYRVLVSAQV